MERPPPFEPCGLVRLPLVLLGRATELGLDRTELLAQAGISETELADPDARLPLRKLWELWRLAIARTGDEDLSLRLIESTPLRAYGLVGYLMTHSATLGAAFERLARYSRLVTDAVAVDWKRDPGEGRLVLTDRLAADPPRSRSDARLAFAIVAARELVGRSMTPREVHLPYSRPPDASALERILGLNLVFDRSPGALVLDGSDVDLPVAGADPTLGGYLDDLAEKLLQAMPATATFQDRVRRAIWSDLRSGRIDLASVASELAMSVRTAQRRLRNEGTSYAALLDDVRRELAMGMLRGRDLAVYEVAFLLGYSEPSTFHRAFRRWTGTSPREFRRATG